MGNRILIILFFIINWSFGQDYQRITVGAGPEDFFLDTSQGKERLIISCDERRDKDSIVEGDIWQMDLNTNVTSILPRINDSSEEFNPHGIFLLNEKGVKYLFVVNHFNIYKGSEIIRYILQGDSLYWDKRFSYNSKINSVCAVSKEHFYFTNDRLFKGKVIEYYQGKLLVLKKGLVYPNGIYARGGYLYFTTTFSGNVLKYPIKGIGELGEREKMANIKGADNIRFYKDYLLTTSHPNFKKFLAHLKSKEKYSPNTAYAVNLKTNEKIILFDTEGDIISGGSTAIIYKGNLYISQIFENFILKKPLGNSLVKN